MMFITLILAPLLIGLRPVSPLPASGGGISGTTTALMYLSRFGYMDPQATNPSNAALLSEESVRESIMRFQEFAGLTQTGELDPETLEMMNAKRCGNKDIIGHGSTARRKKRYALQGSRWRVKHLTYKISKYPSRLARSDVDEEVRRAFQVWADVSELTFEAASSGKIHIDIRFEKGEHGDGDPFDGRGGTLAHAYFPIYSGDAHFDDEEVWTIDLRTGTNLFQVAAHEFGHSLGLSHSDVKSSLMAPFYKGYESNFRLDDDDIRGIQALYGKKPIDSSTSKPGPTAPSAPENPNNPLCMDSTFDDITAMVDTETYVFKGSQYYKLTSDAIAPGYPRSISLDFDGMPGNIDAVFTWTNGKTYFFKNDLYYRFSNMTMDAGYPKEISKGFAGIPNNIDAAFLWSGNGKIYFFKGKDYWRFDPTHRPPVSSSYPKPVSNWEGIPEGITGAFQYTNGYTYFFKNGMYYRFNDRAFKVDTSDPPFPRPVARWWFGCTSAAQRASPNLRTNPAQPDENDVSGDNFDADGSSNEHGGAFRPSPRFSGDNNHQHSQSYHSSDDQDSGSSRTTATITALLVPLMVKLTLL